MLPRTAPSPCRSPVSWKAAREYKSLLLLARSWPHDLSNGLLLRSDFHTLFDNGYITVTNDFKIEVSRKIKEEFSNGRDYYAYHGSPLKVLPKDQSQRPAKEFLEWHQTKRFLA